MKLVALMILLVADVALAQTEAPQPTDDPRVQVASYIVGETLELRTSAEAVQTVLLPSEERIQTVLLGDPSAYSVTVSAKGDSFSLRQLRATIGSSLAVRSDKRLYQFMAAPAYGLPAPYFVLLTFLEKGNDLAARQMPAAQSPESSTTYKVTGNRDVRPTSIRDDGARTYIQWGLSQAIPAVFAVDREGHEEIVNGYMRGAEFTVDRVYEKLIFRIENATSTARRTRVKSR
jgi:type IV secretion system protein VirB9